ncbi:aryl-sulfate sulfotransferase [Jutongia huaianensis]|uniref:Aryl-sulfate sulfotransferase n=1 Tax=Jutongia huaianensis TaxID=2763668 RepID=A0ABR7MY07_9FIRM|nr:aryl-sulfate sulfotransferase [Jutongia huaianensis]MBC8561272.1 aryl-sulfate sulfotransferase [Jutongia huaianensis]
MKKKLLTILITSLVMIAGMGAFLWKMNSVNRQQEKKKAALLQEEMDTDTKDKALEDVDKLELQTLYLSGDKKNVVTREYGSVDAIYNKAKSAAAEDMLTDIKKKRDYSEEDPLWAYNPYGTNPESLYMYFKSKGRFYCRYTVSVDDDKIPDFTRTLDNGASGNVAMEHEYQIIGLVPDKTNYLIFRLYNKKDELANTLYYKVDMPKSYSGAQTILKLEEGRSKTPLQNGLYTVFAGTGTKKQAVLLYDNSGVLRGEFPTKEIGYNMEQIYDTLVYEVDDNTLARVNELGQVVDCLEIPLHHIYGEFAYDGAGAVYVLAQPVQRSQSLGSVVKVEVNSGDVSDALDLSDIPSLVKLVKRADKSGKLKGRNYMAPDSVQVTGINQLLLGSSKYSTIMKVSNVNSLMPKLDYMMTDQKLWNISGKGKAMKRLRKKLLTKALADGQAEPTQATPIVNSILDSGKTTTPELFRSQYGQNALVVEKSSNLAEGQYYVGMLNNNAGRGTSGQKNNSYYYKYLVDESAGTYALLEKERLTWNEKGGNVTPYDESFLYCRSGDHIFEETGKDGRQIRSFHVKGALYRVYKNDWKGFWFY